MQSPIKRLTNWTPICLASARLTDHVPDNRPTIHWDLSVNTHFKSPSEVVKATGTWNDGPNWRLQGVLAV